MQPNKKKEIRTDGDLDQLKDVIDFQNNQYLLKLRQRIGAFVENNSVIGHIIIPQQNGSKEKSEVIAPVVSHKCGIIVLTDELQKGKIQLNLNEKYLPITIDECKHSMAVHGLCPNCGANVLENAEHKSYAFATKEIKFSEEAAIKAEQDFKNKLIRERKLMLILDIDNTIVHSIPLSIPPLSQLNGENEESKDDVHILRFPWDGKALKVKLRPFLTEFLRETSEFYDLYLFTMGTRGYAKCIANIIDPENEFFHFSPNSNKIISREDTNGIKTKKQLLPFDESIYVIIDDRVDVWPQEKNLIRIYPFLYFSEEEYVNNSYDKTIYGNIPPNKNDVYLYFMKHLLLKVHQVYFKAEDMMKSVAMNALLYTIQHSILFKKKIAFFNVLDPGKASEKTLVQFWHSFSYFFQEWSIVKKLGGIPQKEITTETKIILTRKYEKIEKIITAENGENPAVVVDVKWLYYCDHFWMELPFTMFKLSSSKPTFTLNNENDLIETELIQKIEIEKMTYATSIWENLEKVLFKKGELE